MAAAEESRQTFAQSCADFLKTYPQFDGIDIDWEHPVSGGLQPGSPRDARNYVTLLASLRKAIGPDKLLTVAASASPRGIDPIEYADMAGILDWVSVMTYDFHTGGTRTGFNSALYNHDDPSNPRLNLHDAVQAIAAKGIPAVKARRGRAILRSGLARRGVLRGMEHGYRIASSRRLPDDRRDVPEITRLRAVLG